MSPEMFLLNVSQMYYKNCEAQKGYWGEERIGIYLKPL